MAKKVVWLLIRGERLINEDGAAGEAITPGMLVQGEATILKHVTAGGAHQRRFALEREEMGKTYDTDYAVGDCVKVGTAGSGDRINAWLATGITLAAGVDLESAGGGLLRILAAGVKVGRSLEAVTTTGVRLRVRIEVY
jgi:hypothetical protein